MVQRFQREEARYICINDIGLFAMLFFIGLPFISLRTRCGEQSAWAA